MMNRGQLRRSTSLWQHHWLCYMYINTASSLLIQEGQGTNINFWWRCSCLEWSRYIRNARARNSFSCPFAESGLYPYAYNEDQWFWSERCCENTSSLAGVELSRLQGKESKYLGTSGTGTHVYIKSPSLWPLGHKWLTLVSQGNWA